MLSSPDAKLAERDPLLPGLSILLDPHAFAALLAARMDGLDIDDITARYVRYKPHTSCLVAYRVCAGGQTVDLFATTFTRDGLAKHRKHYVRLRRAGLVRKNDLWPDELIVVNRFPADRALPQLPVLADEQRRKKLLTSMLPQSGIPCDSTLHALHYKPEQRYVARLDFPSGEAAVIKAYAGEAFKQANAAVKHVHSRGPLRVPARLGRSRSKRILLLQWLPGTSLVDLYTEVGCNAHSIATVGAALAELHSQDVKRSDTVDAGVLAESLFSNAIMVEYLHPSCAVRAWELSQHLAMTIRKSSAQRCPIHGDFSADQVLVDDEIAAFIDLDSSAIGDPRIDLGSFIATLNMEAILGRIDDATVDDISSKLIQGYRQVREIGPPGQLWPYVALGLLLRAAEPFRYRISDWPTAIEAVIERAETIIRERTF